MNIQIVELKTKEATLRDRLSQLRKEKGSTKEQENLLKEIRQVVDKIEFTAALSKIKIGMKVSAVYKENSKGIVYGFQTIRDRVVGVWVIWEGTESKVPMPEEPTSLILLESK